MEFEVSKEELVLSQEGIADFFRDIGRKIGLHFDDVKDKVKDLEEYVRENGKEIKNPKAFGKFKYYPLFGPQTGSACKDPFKHLAEYSKDISTCYFGPSMIQLSKLFAAKGVSGTYYNIPKIDAEARKILEKAVKSTGYLYGHPLVFMFENDKERYAGKSEWSICAELTDVNESAMYGLSFTFNAVTDAFDYRRRHASVVYGKVLLFDKLFLKSAKENVESYDMQSKDIDSILKILKTGVDNYARMRQQINDSFLALAKSQSGESIWKMDDSQNWNAATAALKRAYGNKVAYVNGFLLELIKIANRALKG